MSDCSRREFLESGTALAAVFGVTDNRHPARRASAAEVQQGDRNAAADTIVINARMYTVDDTRPMAEALAVRNGRFVAVGSTSEIRNLASRDTTVIDAEGMTVTPGFIDAHSHPSGAGVSELLNVNADLRSIAEIQAALRKRAAETPAGDWVIAFKYDDTKLREGRPLTRQDIDAVVPDHPVVVGHRGGHTGVYNSKAFELAGVTADTPDPPDGKFYRENGELTGKVAEHARAVFYGLIPRGSTREQRQAGVALISELMTASGLTSVHQTGGGTDDLIAYQDAYQAGQLRFRMYFFPSGGNAVYRDLRDAGVRTGLGDAHLKIGAVKYVADGSASERTMRMSAPYVGRPDDYGILTMDQDEINEAVEDAHRHGWQIGIHANGDVTIDMVLTAYERAQHEWPRDDPRHRIEHCTLVNPDLLRRIKAVGAIPTPFYTYVHYHGNKWVEYGPDRLRWMFAHRSFLDYGIPVAPASDYTPGPYEPLMAIQSMVTRKDFEGRVWGPNQKITVDEAIRICTIHGAFASFEERDKGSITPGKLADFVMLAKDPHEVDPDHIKEIEVLQTVVGGATMYRS
jgi:predicted amidohydrolase YtcJ